MPSKPPPLNAQLYLEPRALTFDELNGLVSALDNETTRVAACKLLHELAAALERRKDGGTGGDGLRLIKMNVPGGKQSISLILHPAIFAPELWGRTFAEGLLKESAVFNGQSVVELGTGSGWISLLLFARTDVRRIVGLDLNPLAVAVARLNTWLNGSNADGTLKLTRAGIPLVEAFSVAVSDLLGVPLARQERFDHIIGCIPQVLHPDPEVGGGKEHLTNRDLYDLSNYCFQQGILEDRFGLPLIARALEEAHLCLNPNGILTLILGGRPGLEAIEGVFRRRGYEPQLWWSRRIQQADDTDIASLVTLEKAHDINFHFFVSPGSTESIPASTAVSLLAHTQPLYHDLLVIRAQTRFEKPMLAFMENLHELGLDALKSQCDFTSVSEEQVSFLQRLTEELLRHKKLPYPHERGDLSLRQKISSFLRIYCGYAAKPESLFVGPERAQLMSSIAAMVAQHGEFILMSGSLASTYRKPLHLQGFETICGNNDLSELLSLDGLFQPRVCVLAPNETDSPSMLELQALIRHAEKHRDRWYVVDDSANFDIGSALRSNALMRMLDRQPLPANLIFLYGLIKNTVCPDLELSFAINAPEQLIAGLDVAAELTYSRIAYPAQLYYEWLFDDLLAFPFPDNLLQNSPEKPEASVSLAPWFTEICRDAAFAPKPIDPEEPALVRMDYGEFERVVPDVIVRGLIKGFLEPAVPKLSALVKSRVAGYMNFTRSVEVSPERIVLGQGAFPLLGNLIDAMRVRLGRAPLIAVPQGTYGLVFPLVNYHGGQMLEVPTEAEHGFLVTLQALARMPQKPDLIWLTQPNNPSGFYFDSDTVAGIMQFCAEQGIYVIADEIFFLLSDPDEGNWTNPSLSFSTFLAGSESKWLFVAEGPSKVFAAGGLRCGWLICPDETWAVEIQSMTFMPSSVTLRACDSLYAPFQNWNKLSAELNAEQAELLAYLTESKVLLQSHRRQLLELLKEQSCSINGKRGGLFLLVKWDEDKCAKLAREQKVLVNPPSWSRTPGYARVCFSLEPERFAEAMERLR
jgi:aspartate/methionine/tyrosine aminotransferase/methylase of polypeptide subunit release factors